MESFYIEEKNRYSQLLIIYGDILTKTIKRRMIDYYINDFSLAEISENEKVSKNAVYESILHGVKQLDKLESSLSFLEKENRLFNLIDKLVSEEDLNKRKEIASKIKEGI